ncbi:dienelactone hydrolase family protein [bacterium]|nr:dienelactone hydrolase family protein [bacterium]
MVWVLAAWGSGYAERITFKSGEEILSAELFLPTGEKYVQPYPGLIAIHEWWGLNDQVRGEARRLADEGFAVLAVDLYRGRVATESEEAHELMRGLPEDRALGDLKAAFKYLAGRPDVWSDRIGSIGWCMGGGYSLALAAEEPDLRASVIYYGRLITDGARLANIKANVYGFFGEVDRGIPPESVREFERNLTAARGAGPSVKIELYPGAGHAFANKSRPSYNAEAAADAWTKTVRYLKEDLDDVVMRVRKDHQYGRLTDTDLRDMPGRLLVYTLWAENDGNCAPDSVEIIDYLDTGVAAEFQPSGTYGDLFTDSRMPDWGATFDVGVEYSTRDDSTVFLPVTRSTPEADIGALRWQFHFTGGDTSGLGHCGNSNPFLAPDNRNDDRRVLDGFDTSFGAPADADAAYVRFAVRVRLD